MCCVFLCVHPWSVCKTLNPGSHTHKSQRALFFPHMDHNTLICKQIRRSGSPLLPLPLIPCSNSHHLLFFFILLNLNPPLNFYFLLYPDLCVSSFSKAPPSYPMFFFSHWWVQGGHEAMCRVKGLALSLIRNWGGVLHGKLGPECPSWEDVSVTALSTYCQSDSESNTSRDRGTVYT